MTTFAKPARTFEQQAELMLQRGLVGDREVIRERLEYVNYYRLLGYSFPFRLRGAPNDQFVPGTSFETIWDDYVFDQKLRVLLLEAIERIEVAVKTRIAYEHAHAFAPAAYATVPSSLPNLTDGDEKQPRSHASFLKKVKRNLSEGDHQFLRAYRNKYTPNDWPPIWMTCEVLSFGTVVIMFQGCHDRNRERIAAGFNVTSGVLQSWLLMIQNVRNICAHHGRLWNRALGKIPGTPKRATHPDWFEPVPLLTRDSSPKIFSALTICGYLLDIVSKETGWRQRVLALLAEHPGVSTTEMGFPNRWEQSPLWVR